MPDAIADLPTLLRSLDPYLHPERFAFATLPGRVPPGIYETAVATFREGEGLSVVLPVAAARQYGLRYDGTYAMITLRVRSSLAAVGLTAAVAAALSGAGISANVIAAYHHDHVFVPAPSATDALGALRELSAAASPDIPQTRAR